SGSGALAPGTTAISGTGTNTFVNTLFSNVMSTAPAPAPSANPQFFGNSSIDTVPFVIDSNSAGQAAYGGVGTSNTTTSLVIDLGAYTGAGTETQGLFGVNQLDTMLQAFRESAGYQGVTITLAGVGADGTT